MAFTVGLYYPWIDIRDEGWLKTACLYWGKIRSIVPESVDNPYSLVSARELEDEGILIPLRVNPELVDVLDLTDKVVSYFYTPEAKDLLFLDKERKRGRRRNRESSYPIAFSSDEPRKIFK